MAIRYVLSAWLIALFLSIPASVCGQPNSTVDNSSQKVILLQGAYSRLLKGDPLLYEISAQKARHKFNEDEVLPYLLQTGWQIVSLTINEKSRPDKPFGYAVLEKVKRYKRVVIQ